MTKPPYSKPFLTFEEQAKLLEDRGLALVTDENRQSLINLLRNLNFHRFEGYCLRYYRQEPKQHRFKPEASFARIQADYHADKRIRIETLDMIQNFEISLRSQIANVLGARYGAFPYNAEYYHSTKEEWDKMYEEHIIAAVKKANEVCTKSFMQKYNNKVPPIWMTIELLSFGELSQFYKRYLKDEDRNILANNYALSATAMESWLHSLTLLRNRCAHHSKLIDTSNPVPMLMPRNWKIPEYAVLLDIANPRSFYACMLMLCYLSDSTGRKNQTAAYLLKLERIVTELNLDYSQLGFPKAMNMAEIRKKLKLDGYKLE